MSARSGRLHSCIHPNLPLNCPLQGRKKLETERAGEEFLKNAITVFYKRDTLTMTKACKLERSKARICTWKHLSQRQWFYLGCSWQKPPWNPVPRQTRSPGASDTGGWTYLNKRVSLGAAEGGAERSEMFSVYSPECRGGQVLHSGPQPRP